MWELDHLAVSACDLGAGRVAIETALGVPLTPGGRHPTMATHNMLLSLGPDLYLEVIAPDPAAPPPAWPRWFDLDRFRGAPRLTNWVVRCDALGPALARAPAGIGRAVDLQRGAYRWRMGVPPDGRLPFDGAHPALIEWQGPNPAAALPDHGCRLVRLVVTHPQAARLSEALRPLNDARLSLRAGPAPHLAAEIATPTGVKSLT